MIENQWKCQWENWISETSQINKYKLLHTHTHTHTHIYIYINCDTE